MAPILTTDDERINWLRAAKAKGPADTSWVDDLPEANDLPDDEDETIVEIHGPTR